MPAPRHKPNLLNIAFKSGLILFLTTATGCLLSINPMPKLWFYTYGTGAPTGKDSLLSPASFLELRPDGSYTRDFGYFEYGSWIRKDRQLILTSRNRTTYTYQLNKITPGEMQLTLDNGLVGNFDSQSLPSENEKQDPFSVYNNRWRIPATHKESNSEIRRRLYEHCQFWEAYFHWALDKDLPTVDVRSTPSLIKIYGNGFTLKPIEDLPAEWTSFFFDAEDCQKANDIITDIFQHKTIAWAHTDSKYKMFLSAFQQMENFLR
jgi:hypothetical protein